MPTLFVTLCCLLGTSWAGSSMGALSTRALPEETAGAEAVPQVPRKQLTKLDVEGEGIGYDRSAYVWVPEGKGPFPVVFAIHGGKRRDGRDMVPKLKPAEKRGVILVYPNGGEVPGRSGRGWVGPDKPDGDSADRDIRFFRALVHALEQSTPLDKSRMYVTGMSGGGYMTNLLWCEMSDTFAGFGVVSRAMPKVMAATCDVSRPRPYLLMMGTKDPGLLNEYQLPPDETRDFVRTQLGCPDEPDVDRTLPDKGDRLQVNHKRFTCSGGVHFDDYEIVGGGHQWPGSGKPKPDKAEDVDATEVILDAFGL